MEFPKMQKALDSPDTPKSPLAAHSQFHKTVKINVSDLCQNCHLVLLWFPPVIMTKYGLSGKKEGQQWETNHIKEGFAQDGLGDPRLEKLWNKVCLEPWAGEAGGEELRGGLLIFIASEFCLLFPSWNVRKSCLRGQDAQLHCREKESPCK